VRGERPCGSGTADKSDELAPLELTELHTVAPSQEVPA
jgi:hypothetical protein